jgi:hypothetical protein
LSIPDDKCGAQKASRFDQQQFLATILAKFLPNAFVFYRELFRVIGCGSGPFRRLKGHLRRFQPHYLVDTVFTDPPGVPSYFNNFFGHLDNCAKPLSVTLVSGNSLTNPPHARYS